MTDRHDWADHLAGYWRSVWPVECGGGRREKVVKGSGPRIRDGERLHATIRDTGRWNVMFVQREHGELYLQGTTLPGAADVFGWVERVDPISLEASVTTGPLPTGGHEWCGAVVAHANGDLYTVNGRYVHRIDPGCNVVAERELPTDWSHNWLLVLPDGAIVTKDLRLNDATTLLVLDPDDLDIVAQATLPEPSMGRIAVDASERAIYVVGREHVFRYRWTGQLQLDTEWQPRYRSDSDETHGIAWDVALVDGDVWLQDNGDVTFVRVLFSNHPNRFPLPIGKEITPAVPAPWTGAQRVVRLSATNPADVIAFEPFGAPAGWIAAPPLVFDGIVVAFDSGNGRLGAFRLADGSVERLWEKPFRQTIQPIVFAETRELVVNESRSDGVKQSDDVVVLDLDSGVEKGRVTAGTRANAMFLCPGWDRDVYYCTWFDVARVYVGGEASPIPGPT